MRSTRNFRSFLPKAVNKGSFLRKTKKNTNVVDSGRVRTDDLSGVNGMT